MYDFFDSVIPLVGDFSKLVIRTECKEMYKRQVTATLLIITKY